MKSTLYTIGHSNYDLNNFISLLKKHSINVVCDVRSNPYSRFAPQYSRESLKSALATAGIIYIFLGKELGARSANPACYTEGKVQYELLAKEPCFIHGIKRLAEGVNEYQIALMCAEKDPLECHRALLVARKMFELGTPINHILSDGTLEAHESMESRLLVACKLPEGDMFKSREEFISDAYLIQGQRVAYLDESMLQEHQVATT